MFVFLCLTLSLHIYNESVDFLHNSIRTCIPDVTQDFTVDSPLEASAFRIGLFLGPTTSRSCFTITAVNDEFPENPTNSYQFFIPFGGEGSSSYQVSGLSATSITILDDDCK